MKKSNLATEKLKLLLRGILPPQVRNIPFLYRKYRATSIAQKQLSFLSHVEAPFFLIVMPGGIHLAYYSLKCIPLSVNAVIILNGMEQKEVELAKHILPAKHFIWIPSVLPHGYVLDFLFEHVPTSFGVLDYDCFVFDPNLFQEIKTFQNNVSMNAYFAYNNPYLNLKLPQTYFLYFNRDIIKKLQTNYQISCIENPKKWSALPKRVQQRLATFGIDDDHFPEHYKSYFDTLRLVMLLAIADGFSINFLDTSVDKSSHGLFHIGAASPIRSLTSLWNVRGVYCWWRVLAIFPNEELRSFYEIRYGHLLAEDVLDAFPNAREQIGKDYFSFLEKFLEKIVFLETPPF